MDLKKAEEKLDAAVALIEGRRWTKWVLLAVLLLGLLLAATLVFA